MIADFAERMGVSRHAAERLIRTEAAYFSGQSKLDAYREMDVEQYKFVATLDKRTSEICRDMDGKVFRLSEAKTGVNYPPLHVYCRSTTIPHFEGAAPGERAARNEDGKTYYVPVDMTYHEWEKKHGAGGEPERTPKPEPKATEPPKPVEPSKVKQVEPPKLSTTPRPANERAADREFRSIDEAIDFNIDYGRDWIAAITREEADAVYRYTTQYGPALNAELRSGKAGAKEKSFRDLLDSALEKFVLPYGVVTWRGISNIFGTDDPEFLIGMKFGDKGFTSTSMLRDQAYDDVVLIEVHIPAGAVGAPIFLLSRKPDDYEFLLRSQTKFVILDAKNADGRLYLVVEVIADAK